MPRMTHKDVMQGIDEAGERAKEKLSRYQERRQARIDRFEELADKADQRSEDLFKESDRMAKSIPFGQPILVGHHSEKSDRRFRERMQNKMFKGCEEASKADYYRQRADAAKSNRAIYSDDPEAVVKLQKKIEQAERSQEIMVKANKIVRRQPKNQPTEDKIKELMELGLPEDKADTLFIPDFAGRIGFPGYALQNNNANIGRMKKRLADLEQNAARGTEDDYLSEEYEGFQVIEDKEENRIKIIFDGKAEYLRLCKDKGISLKREGFRYAKSTGAWQRHLNNAGRWAVQRVVERMIG